MGDMATVARLNVIREYRISDINVSLPSPFGMKVKDYLASLKSHLYYMAKSENGIVHLRDAAWFNNNPERGLVPWTSIRKWREKVKTSDEHSAH